MKNRLTISQQVRVLDGIREMFGLYQGADSSRKDALDRYKNGLLPLDHIEYFKEHVRGMFSDLMRLNKLSSSPIEAARLDDYREAITMIISGAEILCTSDLVEAVEEMNDDSKAEKKLSVGLN